MEASFPASIRVPRAFCVHFTRLHLGILSRCFLLEEEEERKHGLVFSAFCHAAFFLGIFRPSLIFGFSPSLSLGFCSGEGSVLAALAASAARGAGGLAAFLLAALAIFFRILAKRLSHLACSFLATS